MKPTVGRIVHYYYDPSALPLAAVIAGTFLDGTVTLVVITGRATRRGRAETEFHRGVPFSETPAGGHWSWPPREPV